MLALTRTLDQEIVITVGETKVVLKVLRVYGLKVQLGFEAPPEVTINRREIQDQIDQQGSAK